MLSKKWMLFCSIMILNLISTSTYCYSEFSRTQRAGVPFANEQENDSVRQRPVFEFSSRTTVAYPQANRGPGRPGGTDRQRWAEIDYVPHLDKGGARHSQQVPLQQKIHTTSRASFMSRPRTQ